MVAIYGKGIVALSRGRLRSLTRRSFIILPVCCRRAEKFHDHVALAPSRDGVVFYRFDAQVNEVSGGLVGWWRRDNDPVRRLPCHSHASRRSSFGRIWSHRRPLGC